MGTGWRLKKSLDHYSLVQYTKNKQAAINPEHVAAIVDKGKQRYIVLSHGDPNWGVIGSPETLVHLMNKLQRGDD